MDFRDIFPPLEEKGRDIMDILIDIFLYDWMKINTETNLAYINSIIIGYPCYPGYMGTLDFKKFSTIK